MEQYKCKKSVFCACFLFSLTLGTISGVFLFRCFISSNGSVFLIDSDYFGTTANALTLIRPFVVMLTLIFHPKGRKFVFLFVVLRGLLMAFFSSAVWFCGGNVAALLLRFMLFFPAYYLFCGMVFSNRCRSIVLV